MLNKHGAAEVAEQGELTPCCSVTQQGEQVGGCLNSWAEL